MNTFTKRSLFALIMCGSLCVAPAYAADPPSSTKAAAPTKEQREKMAQAHEKLAACLRSDRDVSECHHDMMQQCKEIKGEACEHMKQHMRHEHDEHQSHQGHSASSQPESK